ncbi:hypothetical protein QTO34_006672 [Cnephaeus nilssonii]|uniref:Uncharacterized protein n=1 Tax=Cnephaeus nilssonii TaxID=3371016 RepID=A0AA40LHP7_CNENI|nr:hypothetical protein QTO34_006672 [Eptesicus nilssonii]
MVLDFTACYLPGAVSSLTGPSLNSAEGGRLTQASSQSGLAYSSANSIDRALTDCFLLPQALVLERRLNTISALEKLPMCPGHIGRPSNVVSTVTETMPRELRKHRGQGRGGLLEITLSCEKLLRICKDLATRRVLTCLTLVPALQLGLLCHAKELGHSFRSWSALKCFKPGDCPSKTGVLEIPPSTCWAWGFTGDQ